MVTSNNRQGYFVTGSDTGVGKTWISRQIIRQLSQSGIQVKARKPVESGCQQLDDGSLFPADGDALNRACAEPESLFNVTPYRFRAALAPDRAARLENQFISLQHLIDAVHAGLLAEDRVVVEGAGGFYSPIAEDGLNSDLAQALNLKLIVVVNDRLGAINQALLTARAAQREGLTVAAIILNQADEEAADGMENLTDLQSRTELPVYRCSHNSALPDINWT